MVYFIDMTLRPLTSSYCGLVYLPITIWGRCCFSRRIPPPTRDLSTNTGHELLCSCCPVEMATINGEYCRSSTVRSGVRRCDHIAPVLCNLHWLPVRQPVIFKTAVLRWKCVHGVAPAYLRELCECVREICLMVARD